MFDLPLGFTLSWYGYSATNISQVNGNGCLLFGGTALSMCPYYAVYATGVVYYRKVTTTADLASVSSYVTTAYSKASFTATGAYVVTFYYVTDSKGFSNTFQVVLATDGTHSYVIYNFGPCSTPNAKSFVQNGTSSYIMWDNTAASYTDISYVYDYFNYESAVTVSQLTNACTQGTFIFSYPVQTVSCSTTTTTTTTTSTTTTTTAAAVSYGHVWGLYAIGAVLLVITFITCILAVIVCVLRLKANREITQQEVASPALTQLPQPGYTTPTPNFGVAQQQNSPMTTVHTTY
jgi:hypothetical protein